MLGGLDWVGLVRDFGICNARIVIGDGEKLSENWPTSVSTYACTERGLGLYVDLSE